MNHLNVRPVSRSLIQRRPLPAAEARSKMWFHCSSRFMDWHGGSLGVGSSRILVNDYAILVRLTERDAVSCSCVNGVCCYWLASDQKGLLDSEAPLLVSLTEMHLIQQVKRHILQKEDKRDRKTKREGNYNEKRKTRGNHHARQRRDITDSNHQEEESTS